jgi:hypothetical protein
MRRVLPNLHLPSETTQTASISTSPVRVRRRRNGLAMGEPLATSASIERRGVRLKEPREPTSRRRTRLRSQSEASYSWPETIGTGQVCPEASRDDLATAWGPRPQSGIERVCAGSQVHGVEGRGLGLLKGGLRKVDRVKRIGLGHIGIRRRLMGVEPILVFLDVALRQD